MITLSAIITIKGHNPSPFVIGQTPVGSGLIGAEIVRDEFINTRNILSLDAGVSDRETGATISWGLISNGGQLSFNKNEEFVRLASIGVEIEGSKVEVFLNNTATKKKERIGEYFVSKFSYDVSSKVSTIQFTDGLEDWQDATFEGFSVDPLNLEPIYCSKLYEKMRGETESAFGVVVEPFLELNEATRKHLNRYYLPTSLVKAQSFWSVWDKFGKATQTHIFKKPNGKITCRYEGGN